MSFILDALRKSETERQQQTGPVLADSHYRVTKTNKTIWIPLLVVVLAVNAVVLAFVMNTGSPGSEEAPRTTDQETVSRPPPDPAIRPLAREVGNNKIAAATDVEAEQKTTPAQPVPVAAQFDAATATEPDTTEAGVIQEGLPSLQQLLLAGEISVQPLHLDIHVYTDARPERFVFINMKKYQEGGTLAEGPSVEEITRTGVILRYRGDRFTLDRD